MNESKNFNGFYIERIDLIDMVESESEAKEMVAKLSANNNDECVYKYSPSNHQPIIEKEKARTWYHLGAAHGMGSDFEQVWNKTLE